MRNGTSTMPTGDNPTFWDSSQEGAGRARAPWGPEGQLGRITLTRGNRRAGAQSRERVAVEIKIALRRAGSEGQLEAS